MVIMTGLEKLVKHIEDDAKNAAQAAVAEAEKNADEILNQAKAEGEKKSADILRQSESDVKAALSRAESAALLKEKKLLLNAKQQMIEDVLANAKNKLLKLPDTEYFDIIIKMIKKYASQQKGEVIFSKVDKKRLPKQFEEKIRTALSEKTGAELLISEQTRDIDGGFVLVYGKVEENCSFEALFFAEKEFLQDKVSKVLFC